MTINEWIGLYLSGCFFTYGIVFAWWHEAFPIMKESIYKDNLSIALIMGIMSFLGLAIHLAFTLSKGYFPANGFKLF